MTHNLYIAVLWDVLVPSTVNFIFWGIIFAKIINIILVSIESEISLILNKDTNVGNFLNEII
jgi:hypothetical protein